ncbi:MAG TPA: hypothetical protein VFH80_30885 [Solirubrobacteraceae bacterium]|nr:hypothetical protein [Solirubrobacteraceae bacterium]
MSSAKWTDRKVAELAMIVAEAAKGIRPWELPRSVLGRLRSVANSPHSEYLMFTSRDVRRTVKYVADALIPSFHRHAPSWVPAGLRSVFFHQTTIVRWPDQAGRYDSFPAEEWFFINGILTNPGMAAWNANYLAAIFPRPLTIIQNATDGPIADLLECADEKAFGMNGEPVDVGFPEVYRALKDGTKDRVVIIAHSQGTLISAVMARLLRLVYDRVGELLSAAERADELAALRRTGVTLDPNDFADVTSAELDRLEIYCFANCASEMRYVDPTAGLPWIESLGNEHDLVARLGMLAPDRKNEQIAIDGPLWVHRGAWGHLLSAHYLRAIELAQGGGSSPGPATTTAEPYEQFGGAAAGAPRLFAYVNAGKPAQGGGDDPGVRAVSPTT